MGNMMADVPKRTMGDAISEAAAMIGKLGASKGGKARARVLSKARQSEIGTMGARARWKRAKARTRKT